ncbi:MAG: molecular chaperone TorD family protein [Adlercreutzia sp.]|nr:molecular chaperone TorD family protein [Adlercreutzia sp.]
MESSHLMLEELSRAFAFFGNSLMRPMSQTESLGLDPSFWEAFPAFGSPALATALDELAAWARDDRGDAERVQAASVEYARLFIGPPAPAAPPWESFYLAENVETGFGDPTFRMRSLLRKAGIVLAGPTNQYEDHIGVELLWLSYGLQCAANSPSARAEEPPNAEGAGPTPTLADLAAFIDAHPGRWIDAFEAAVAATGAEGYHHRLVIAVRALLEQARELL